MKVGMRTMKKIILTIEAEIDNKELTEMESSQNDYNPLSVE